MPGAPSSRHGRVSGFRIGCAGRITEPFLGLARRGDPPACGRFTLADGWYPEQKLTLGEAWEAFTSDLPMPPTPNTGLDNWPTAILLT